MGIVVNRMTVGIIFAFFYKFIIAISALVTGISLSGDIESLFSSLEDRDIQENLFILAWWLGSTMVISLVALTLVRYRKYVSPYKGEKNIGTPPKITLITTFIIGSMILILVLATHLIMGLFVEPGSETDIETIYETAISGNFMPLLVSIFFSTIAGFIVVWVSNRAEKVRKFTEKIGISDITLINMKKKDDSTHTSLTAGLDPGALIHVGKKKMEQVKYSVIKYSVDSYNEQKDTSLEEALRDVDTSLVTWINVSGIHDSNIIRKFGEKFLLHPLIQSDIMNTELRPMIHFDNDYIFLTMKIPDLGGQTKISVEQISIVIGKNFILTFQETNIDIFDPIRKRIRESIGRIRSTNSDYLGYAIADSIVDRFFVILEKISDVTEAVEETMMSDPNPQILETIHSLKRQMLHLRRAVWPLREILDKLERDENTIIQNETKAYIRDVYTHAIQIMDTIEGLRDMISGLLDTYLSSLSNKMNEVMKALTIIASIFIPISAIAGIYGTNFVHIPETQWEHGYFAMLAAMVLITLIMLAWFKKKAWL